MMRRRSSRGRRGFSLKSSRVALYRPRPSLRGLAIGPTPQTHRWGTASAAHCGVTLAVTGSGTRLCRPERRQAVRRSAVAVDKFEAIHCVC